MVLHLVTDVSLFPFASFFNRMSSSQSNHSGEAVLTSLVHNALMKLRNGELKARFGLEESSFHHMTRIPDLSEKDAPLYVLLRAAASFDHADDKVRFHRGKSTKYKKKCAKESRKLLLILTRDKWYQVVKAFIDQNAVGKRKDSDEAAAASVQKRKKRCTGRVLVEDDDQYGVNVEEDNQAQEKDQFLNKDLVKDNIDQVDDDDQVNNNDQVDDDLSVEDGNQVEEDFQVYDKDRDMLRHVPDCVKARFGHIYFTKWGKGRQARYLPVLVVNPFDIPPGDIRQAWIANFNSSYCTGSLASLSNLVFWYGSLTVKQLAFSFIPTKNLVDFKTGCLRGYDGLPKFLAEKLVKKGTVLSKLDQQHCQALLEMKEDVTCRQPNHRWPHRMKILCLEFETAPGLADKRAESAHSTTDCRASSNVATGTKKQTGKPKSVAKKTKPLSESREQAKLEKIFHDLGNIVDAELLPPSQFLPPEFSGDGPWCQANRLFRLLLAYPRRLAGVSYRQRRRFNKVTRDGRCDNKVCKRDASFDPIEFGTKFIVDPHADEWPPGFEKLQAEDVIVLDESWVVPLPTGEGKENVCIRRMWLEDASSTKPKMFAHLVCQMECNLTKNKRQEFIRTLLECAKIKGNVTRGKKRLDLSELYMCFGFRFAYDGKKVGCYTYMDGVDKETQEKYNAKIANIMDSLWEIAFGKMDPDTLNAMLSVAKVTNFSDVTMTATGLHSQFSCSRNYMVRSHTDEDGLVGVVSVLDPIEPNSRKTITHFIFPEFKMAFPLKSGDVLIFDPRVMHCSCNPRNKKAFIFSAYTSAKTVHAHIANWMLEKGILDG
jgi:hypothetical protein